MSFSRYHWPTHDLDEISAVKQVLDSGCTNYWTGQEGRAFESEFAAFIGTRYAVALMNGTIALEAALYALDIGPGDEVITSCRTFIASASAIVMRGAVPVLADVDLLSQNITPATIAPCITARTKAIIVVHLAGWPADMEAIMALAKQHQLRVIEDCAQAHGACWQGRKVGSWGDIGAFSFCQDKIMTTGGEGGMVTTHDEVLWRKMWSFKDHGKNKDKLNQPQENLGYRWVHDAFGTNWRMTEMQAAIGRVQLQKLPSWLALRKRNADILTEVFQSIPALSIPKPPLAAQHAYYKYYTFVRSEALRPGWDRNRIMQTLSAQGITCFSGICPDISLEQAFSQKKLCPSPRPNAALLGDTSLMFLVHPTLPPAVMQQTAKKAQNVLQQAMISVAS